MSSVSNEIYNHIETQIVNGELKPGDKLPSENELCKIWNTSRVSVRQALERLLSLGILHKVRGGGTYISEPDPAIFINPLLPFVIFREENIIDILEFRNVIEVGSVRLCAERRNTENLKKLKECIEIMKECSHDTVKFAEADLEFHMEIARGSKNPVNVKINEMLRHTMRKHQIRLNAMIGSSGGLKEHDNIYIAIEDRNAELAAHFMEKHIARTIKDIKEIHYQG